MLTWKRLIEISIIQFTNIPVQIGNNSNLMEDVQLGTNKNLTLLDRSEINFHLQQKKNK